MMQTHPLSTPSKLAVPVRRRSVISLTPLIDVVFILLVFFMLASSFLDWRSITLDTVKPPSVVPKKVNDRKPLLLSVSETETRLNGEVMQMGQLLDLLQRRLDSNPEATVRVKPLGDTRLQIVIGVLDQLKLAGITRLTMVRDREWQSPTDR